MPDNAGSLAQNGPAPDGDEDDTIYVVVANYEDQYSIWPADRDLPRGWRPMGMQGRKTECLAHIDVVWTDMRPLSLRRQMDGAS